MQDWYLQHEARYRTQSAIERAEAHRQRVVLGADATTRLATHVLRIADRIRAWEYARYSAALPTTLGEGRHQAGVHPA